MREPLVKLLTFTLSNKLLRTRDRAFNQRRKNHKKGRSTFCVHEKSRTTRLPGTMDYQEVLRELATIRDKARQCTKKGS